MTIVDRDCICTPEDVIAGHAAEGCPKHSPLRIVRAEYLRHLARSLGALSFGLRLVRVACLVAMVVGTVQDDAGRVALGAAVLLASYWPFFICKRSRRALMEYADRVESDATSGPH